MNSKDIVYVNGRFVARAEARVSVEDRGFVFGDGVYEVVRAINGRLFATRFHNDRLRRSLEGIRISLDRENTAERFVEIGKQLLTENDLQRGDDHVRARIQEDRDAWRRLARTGNGHAFIIVAISRQVAFAAGAPPGPGPPAGT